MECRWGINISISAIFRIFRNFSHFFAIFYDLEIWPTLIHLPFVSCVVVNVSSSADSFLHIFASAMLPDEDPASSNESSGMHISL